MAKQNGIALGVARTFIENYYRRYPKVKDWQDLNIKIVKASREVTSEHSESGLPIGKGTLHSVTGRTYTFKEYENVRQGHADVSFSPTQIKNYPVQGLATGDIVPMVLGRMWRYLAASNTEDEIVLVNTIHDSILLDCKDMNTAKKWAPILLSIMANAPEYFKDMFGIEFNMPLTAEAKVGKTWGEMKKLEIHS